MLNGAYYVVVIAVAIWGIVSGFRKGIFRLIGSVLGVSFGIVAVHLLASDFLLWVDGLLPDAVSGFHRSFLAQTLTCGVIYLAVSWLVSILAFPLSLVLRVLGKGVITCIVGAIFRTFQFLMVVSIFYNLIVDVDSTGSLARTARYHDGNVVEAVLKIAPAVLDFPSAEDVGHRQQLEDARKIS